MEDLKKCVCGETAKSGLTATVGIFGTGCDRCGRFVTGPDFEENEKVWNRAETLLIKAAREDERNFAIWKTVEWMIENVNTERLEHEDTPAYASKVRKALEAALPKVER